jgi:hypothetical protein
VIFEQYQSIDRDHRPMPVTYLFWPNQHISFTRIAAWRRDFDLDAAGPAGRLQSVNVEGAIK